MVSGERFFLINSSTTEQFTIIFTINLYLFNENPNQNDPKKNATKCWKKSGTRPVAFSKNGGSRNAILSLRLIIERAFIREETVYIGFIDLVKALDNANWKIMCKILKQIRRKFRKRSLIYNLYQIQMEKLNIGDDQSETKIK